VNDKDLAIKRNNTARLFQFTDKSHRNDIRININNSFEHELAKFIISWNLKKEGKEFITEATFENRLGRADIVILDNSEIIEILETEELVDAKKKELKYPLPIRFIRARGILKDVVEVNL